MELSTHKYSFRLRHRQRIAIFGVWLDRYQNGETTHTFTKTACTTTSEAERRAVRSRKRTENATRRKSPWVRNPLIRTVILGFRSLVTVWFCLQYSSQLFYYWRSSSMEASNELIKKLLEYNFIRKNHEPYKQFQNETLFNALKYANNRDSNAESLYLKLDKERAEVEEYNFSIKRQVEGALDAVVEEAKNMFLNRWVVYNYINRGLISNSMQYMFVKEVYIDNRSDIEHTTHFIVLKGPSIFVEETPNRIDSRMNYTDDEVIKFIPAVYYRDDKEIKELVRYSQLHYGNEAEFKERIDAIIANFTTNVRTISELMLDKAVPNDA